MPRRLIVSLAAAGAALCTLALAPLSLHRSLWAAWEMAPPGQLILAVNLSQPGGGLGLRAASLQLPAELPTLQDRTSRFVYSRQAAGETLVIVPRLFTVGIPAEIARPLAAYGWQLGRRGQVIYAVRGGGAAPAPSLSSARGAAQRLISMNVAKQPLIIFAAGERQALPQLAQPVTAIALARREAGKVIITADIKPNLTAQRAQPAAPPAGENDVTIRVPGAALSELPAPLKAAWQRGIGEKLGLVEGKEGLIPSFAQLQELRVIVSGNSAALAIQGNPENAIQHITSLLQEAEARRRPATRSFRLPDGTIGRETVPGELEPVFTAAPDASGCLSPLPDRTHLWLCRQDNVVAVGTGKEITRETLQGDTSRWQLHARGPYAALLGVPEVISLTASGEDSTAQIVITLRE